LAKEQNNICSTVGHLSAETVSDVRYLNNIGVIKILRTRVWIGAPGQKLYLEKKNDL